MDLTRFIAIADEAQGHPLSWPLAIGLSVFSVANLIVLAQATPSTDTSSR